MKKVLFNGCSFVAGDEIALEIFKKEIGNHNIIWGPSLFKNYDNWTNYKICRDKHNLSGQVSKLLDIKTINIAEDGNSNENIAISTINYFLELTEEVSDYHVCIGWTAMNRKMKWVSEKNRFFNMNISNLYEPNNQYLGTTKYDDWIKSNLVESDDEDHALSYISSILLLENYLIANKISYTFWRSIGTPQDGESAKKFKDLALRTGRINQTRISNKNSWIQFDKESELPWFGSSWANQIKSENNASYYVSDRNYHPSVTAASIFAEKIGNNILNTNQI